MCEIEGESPEFQSTEWRISRKVHECVACHEGISPGDRYHVTAGRWDGEFLTFKHCTRCEKMCAALWKAGVEWLDFHLDCGEVWDDVFGKPPPEVAALAFALPGDFVSVGGAPSE